MQQTTFISLPLVLLAGLFLFSGFPAWGQVTYQGGVALTAARFEGKGIDTDGSVGIHLHAEPRLYRVLALRLEGGADYLGRLCFEGNGTCADRKSSSSGTFMLSGSAAIGMLTPPVYLGPRSGGAEAAVGVFAGREGLLAGIGQGDCLNCRVPGADVRGGFFLEPTLEVWFFSGFGIGTAYRIYHGASDMHRRFLVRLIVADGR